MLNFVRVIAHSPDPLMLACAEPVADPPASKSPLDPELVRVILSRPGRRLCRSLDHAEADPRR